MTEEVNEVAGTNPAVSVKPTKTDKFQPLYEDLLKRPGGDVVVARLKAFIEAT